MTQCQAIIRRTAIALALTIGLICALPDAAHATSEINKSLFGGVAIEGTDPVAYFLEGRAMAGSSDFTYDWKGAEWRFASAANRDAFAAAPDSYAPRYGGYCAWAVSQGSTAGIDPDAWSIVDGALYLNYSDSIQARWSQDIPGNIAKAEANWPDVLED
ncbi:MAG: YHS domain-containing (seleno)protein [Alphaproteobacteria bacterium]|jgi:YHS domain-containing protein